MHTRVWGLGMLNSDTETPVYFSLWLSFVLYRTYLFCNINVFCQICNSDLFPTFITLVLLHVGMVLLIVLPPISSVPKVRSTKVANVGLQYWRHLIATVYKGVVHKWRNFYPFPSSQFNYWGFYIVVTKPLKSSPSRPLRHLWMTPKSGQNIDKNFESLNQIA